MAKYKLAFLLVAPLAIVACRGRSADESRAAVAANSSVHTISLPHYQPDLPDAPGRDVFASSCLSCHSQRYITMQPPLTAPKWEATVKKMIATYNAPVADDRVATLVQYLVAAKENGPRQQWDAIAVESPADVASIDLSHADATRGAAVYVKSCAACHGAAGAGNGATAKTMLPHPTDLTAGRMSPSAIAAAIRHGVRATAMPAAVGLSAGDVADVVAYTVQFQRGDAPAAPLVDPDKVAVLYAANCSSCHGQTGAGDGLAAAVAPRPPANFHLKQPNADYAVRVITDGVAGTTMPAWKTKLDESQRRALAGYVRAFYGQ